MNVELTEEQIVHLISFLSDNNQYETDEESIEFWDEIIVALKTAKGDKA